MSPLERDAQSPISRFVASVKKASTRTAALSLASNVLELGSDLFKLSFLCRRPPAVRAADIGMWDDLLLALVVLSVFTNLWLFGFASDQMALLFPSLFRHQLSVPVLHVAEHEYGVKKGMGRFVPS